MTIYFSLHSQMTAWSPLTVNGGPTFPNSPTLPVGRPKRFSTIPPVRPSRFSPPDCTLRRPGAQTLVLPTIVCRSCLWMQQSPSPNYFFQEEGNPRRHTCVAFELTTEITLLFISWLFITILSRQPYAVMNGEM